MTLPLELNAKVVEMVSDQEDAWRDRVEDPEGRVGHINCLSSVALVNKELRGLAAKHQFDTLVSDKAWQPVFRFAILQRFGHHITRVSFVKSDSTQFDNVLAIISQLSSLRALTFTREAAVALFGSGVALLSAPDPTLGSDASYYRAEMLRNISSIITSLTLHNFPPSTSLGLVRLFPNLRILVLQNVGEAANEEEVKRLAHGIAALRHLTHLSIAFAVTTALGWTTEALEPLQSNPPPLQYLQLFDFPLDQPTINLISVFGSTLETLSLGVWVRRVDFASSVALQLPRLTSFNLAGDQEGYTGVLRLFPPSSTLSHFSLVDINTDIEPTDPILQSFLKSQPNLYALHLGRQKGLYPMNDLRIRSAFTASSLAAYAELVRSRDMDPSVLDQRHLSPFHPNAGLDYTGNKASYLKEALVRTLEFGRNEVERMFGEGNVARAVGWVAKLKALEDERLVWKD